MNTPLRAALLAPALLLSSCASLGQVIQPPRFETVDGRPAELRLLPPSAGRPLGGAAVRLWARVENPNPLGITLSTLAGGLLLEGKRAAEVNFPLGLPLPAGRDTVIPLEIGLSFSDLPGLTDVASRAVSGAPIGYRLDGRVGVDAGLLGEQTFGPMTLLRGDLQVRR